MLNVARTPSTLGKDAKSIHAQKAYKAPSRRWELRRTAGRLLFDPAGGRQQAHRTVHCGRSMNGESVGVYRQVTGQGGRLSGLVTCGNGWTCPACCMKIAEGRRKELSAGLVCHVQLGGQAHLITLTAPHDASMRLFDFLQRFDNARRAWKNSRAYKAASKTTVRLGSACSSETTYGVNGWHPHLHELWFSRHLLTQQQQAALQAEWVKQLLRAGLGDQRDITDMFAHACDIRGGKDAADYITKYGREETWGLSDELTRQHAKEAKGDHVTPFGLLRLVADGDVAPGGRDPAALFREFAHTMHGRRLMTWSPGLRAALELGQELTDAQLAEEPAPDESFVGRLTADQWRDVLARNAEAELLDYAVGMCIDPDTGQQDLDEWIDWLRTRPKVSGGWAIDGFRRLH